MIRLTRLDGSEFYINADLIQSVQSTPDTHIVLMNGPSYVVREADREVVARVIEYRRHQVRGERGQSRPVHSVPGGSGAEAGPNRRGRCRRRNRSSERDRVRGGSQCLMTRKTPRTRTT
ncbi:MAG: hypothetical protein EXR66_00495 [Dehalococcoidia bacterium]|nr:hypothetical protein [Dehalococcoidia bacterium]